METFKIEIQEFLSEIVEVEASNVEEAVSKVKEMYRNEEIVLTDNNYVTTEIEEFPKTEKSLIELLSNGDNFYLIENHFIYFWGLDIKSKKIPLNKKILKFIDDNDIPYNEVCEFNENSDFQLFKSFY